MVNDKKDVTFDIWMHSMRAMLYNLHNPLVQARSISIVPDQLRTSNEEAYMPKVVSMGPIHRGNRRALLYMEGIKRRCMMSLLHRTSNAVENLEMCSSAIYDLDEVVRSCYVNDIKFDSYGLAKIMLLDGCFLLELLISGSKELNTELPFNTGPGAEIGKNEDVLADLTVLENQIPFLIIVELATLLFPHVFSVRDGKKKIKEPLLSLLGYRPPKNGSDDKYDAVCAHVLELAHSFITRKAPERQDQNIVEERQDQMSVACDVGTHMAINIVGNVVDKSNEETEKSHKKIPCMRLWSPTAPNQQPKLKICATRLLVAGIKIEAIDTNHSEFGFDRDIGFSQRKLVIPCLHITETTEVKWRNFIAWEQIRNDHARYIGNETGVSCKFNWYALFFHGLICCVHDVQLLKQQKVITVNSKKGRKISNKELLDLFNKITAGVQGSQIDEDSSFSQLFRELNSNSQTVSCHAGKRIIIQHYFRRFLRFLTDIWDWCIRRNWRSIFIFLRHIPTEWKLAALLFVTPLLGLSISETIFCRR